MDSRTCRQCGIEKPLQDFHPSHRCHFGRTYQCKSCWNAYLRNHNATYTKTKSGFLMRAYRNMKSRVEGVQWRKAHLYAGKSLMPKDAFYEWGIASPEFHRLFADWEAAGYPRAKTPSVDRIDSALGYEPSNMQWVTHSENSRRGNQSRIAQGLWPSKAA
jgi:hypothetical protein